MKTKSLHNQLIEWRHDLHMNPQISFEEEYASNKVATLLNDFGIEVHKGIAKRSFTRKFTLADDIEIKDAKLKNGLLEIELEQIVPEHKKPKTIKVK